MAKGIVRSVDAHEHALKRIEELGTGLIQVGRLIKSYVADISAEIEPSAAQFEDEPKTTPFAAADSPVPEIPQCAVHQLPMTRVNGKHGVFWSCHTKTDGKWCEYKPPIA